MPQEIGNTKVYTMQEVAEVLGRSQPYVSALVTEGKLNVKKFSKQHLIEHHDLVVYLNEINLPANIIEYRLGIRSPKNGAVINKESSVA